jgi:hypothetical protein
MYHLARYVGSGAESSSGGSLAAPGLEEWFVAFATDLRGAGWRRYRVPRRRHPSSRLALSGGCSRVPVADTEGGSTANNNIG